MPILSMIGSMFGGQIIDKLFGTFGDIIMRWQQKQITEIEAKQAMTLALVGAFKEIEVAHAEAITKMYSVFMGTVQRSRGVMIAFVFILISQGVMLLWFQFGIPMAVILIRYYSGDQEWHYPSAGSTADWAYLLVAALCGLGLTLDKSAGGITGALKSLIGK